MKRFDDRALEEYITIPLIVSRAIWLARNASIFSDKETPFQVQHQIKFSYEGIRLCAKIKKTGRRIKKNTEYN